LKVLVRLGFDFKYLLSHSIFNVLLVSLSSRWKRNNYNRMFCIHK
jgi:hypothetical protein